LAQLLLQRQIFSADTRLYLQALTRQTAVFGVWFRALFAF
jgi:hypothetical protein